MSGSASLSLGRREATWWEVGLGGTPADEDMLAVIVNAVEESAANGEICGVFCSDRQSLKQRKDSELQNEVVFRG